jgi:hypothetical protein
VARQHHRIWRMCCSSMPQQAAAVGATLH